VNNLENQWHSYRLMKKTLSATVDEHFVSYLLYYPSLKVLLTLRSTQERFERSANPKVKTPKTTRTCQVIRP
jgi:hypothetical protein